MPLAFPFSPASMVIPIEGLRNTYKALCFVEGKCKSIDKIDQARLSSSASQYKNHAFKGKRALRITYLQKDFYQNLFHNVSVMGIVFFESADC